MHLRNNTEKTRSIGIRGGGMGPIWDAHLRPDSLPAWVELKPGPPTMPLVKADCAGCGQLVRLSFPPSWVDKLQTVSGFRN